ncbi:hypothetical protein EV424DRAFT_1540268 [Suillus variegatus]|nr:hypothetical protein EV424DRAFT_1540268 [Suillus variegatus]
MTYVSNDPSRWSQINVNIFVSYWTVAAGVVVVYDRVLTLAQEIELIWVGGKSPVSKENKSNEFATETTMVSHDRAVFDYSLYGNTIFCCLSSGNYAIGIADRCRMSEIPTIELGSTNDSIGAITFYAINSITVASTAMLAEEFIFSGTYMCISFFGRDDALLFSMIWMLYTVWEVLALCLSVWVAVKHFRELRRLGPSTGSTIGDCFRVLIRCHVLYFASFLGVYCTQLAVYLSPEISNSEFQILAGAGEILSVVQMFVLGPRLILSVREYHAKLVAYSDAETSMNSIVFQERVHVSTSSTV